jgi:GT2 family glycosyltransferase
MKEKYFSKFFVSIIIPTIERPDIFEDCLSSLIKAVKVLHRFETIVVINGVNKLNFSRSVEVARKYKKKLNIKIIKRFGRIGSAKARNIGIRKAKGDLIFFFDDDTEILPDYFKKTLPLFLNKRVGAVGGAEIKGGITKFHKIWFAIRKPGIITSTGEIVSNFFYHENFKGFIPVFHLHGSNFGLRKKLIKKIGFFDERYIGVQREETDFIYRVKKIGYKLVFIPSTGVIHKQTVYGGNVPPKKKKEWCYWYYRNSGYFFFKNIYENKKLRAISFLIREFIFGLIKVFAYMNPFYMVEYPKIYEGYILWRRTRKFGTELKV